MTESIYENNGSRVGGIAAEQLRSIIERIENMDEEIAEKKADRKNILAEAKSAGFDTKIINIIIKLRKLDPMDREEQSELTDLYLAAVGMA